MSEVEIMTMHNQVTQIIHLLKIVESSQFHVLLSCRQDFCLKFQKMNELKVFTIRFLYKRTSRKKSKKKKEFQIYPLCHIEARDTIYNSRDAKTNNNC